MFDLPRIKSAVRRWKPDFESGTAYDDSIVKQSAGVFGCFGVVTLTKRDRQADKDTIERPVLFFRMTRGRLRFFLTDNYTTARLQSVSGSSQANA
jgi:hypothetical protein